MGLCPYFTLDNAGVLSVFLVWIFTVKEIFRSIIHFVDIHIGSWEHYSLDNTWESMELCGPSESQMEEFRSRTPAIQYDSIYSCNPKLQECTVCPMEFEPEAEINHLSCRHVFHKLCLEKWLEYWNVTCPLCRNYMLPQEDEKNAHPT